MEAMIWIGLIILFVVVEIATVGLTSIWFAGGALISLILCLCGVGLGWQIGRADVISGIVGVFFVVSLVLVAFTRPWAVKYLKPHLIRTNYEQAIGENVCLTETVDNQRGTGTAVYKGQEWTARASEDGKRYEAGTIVKVKEIRGVTMYVTESGLMPQVPTTPQTEQEAE